MSIKEFIFNGVYLGKTCGKCDGRGGGYSKEDFERRPRLVYIDPLWRKCEVCRGKGVVDSEEGAVLRQWLGN